MRDLLRLYFRYLGSSVRTQLQHRASTWMLAFGSLVVCGSELVAIRALFQRFQSIAGFALAEVALLYGMANVAFALAEAFTRGFDRFDALIVTGEFDRILLRPRSTLFQVAAQELHLMRSGRLTLGALALGWSLTQLAIDWDAARALLIPCAIAGGACTFAALFVVNATLAFYTTQGLEVMNTVTYGGLETAQYPLAIYEPSLRKFFTFVVPLASMNYLPALVLLDRAPPGSALAWAGMLSPLAGPAFLVASALVWRVGVRRYRSTGA
jgi:ABC-2 type transport system permease protein